MSQNAPPLKDIDDLIPDLRNPKDTDRNRRKRVRQGRLTLRSYLGLPELGHTESTDSSPIGNGKVRKALEARVDAMLKKAAEVTANTAGSSSGIRETKA